MCSLQGRELAEAAWQLLDILGAAAGGAFAAEQMPAAGGGSTSTSSTSSTSSSGGGGGSTTSSGANTGSSSFAAAGFFGSSGGDIAAVNTLTAVRCLELLQAALKQRKEELAQCSTIADCRQLCASLAAQELNPSSGIAAQAAALLQEHWQRPEQQAEAVQWLAQMVPTRSCAYLRCANLGVGGGPGPGEGEGSKRCSRCRAVWYCGTDCSHADWRGPAGHRRVCRALDEARRPAGLSAPLAHLPACPTS